MTLLAVFIVTWVLFATIGKRQEWSNTISGGGGFLVACVAVIALAIVTADPVENVQDAASNRAEIVTLSATVLFSGTQFTIINNDSFDWVNVELDINPGTFFSGYTLKTGRMVAGETYTVGALQFAKSDGERFNPVTTKALAIAISADTPSGTGYYSGSWE